MLLHLILCTQVSNVWMIKFEAEGEGRHGSLAFVTCSILKLQAPGPAFALSSAFHLLRWFSVLNTYGCQGFSAGPQGSFPSQLFSYGTSAGL